MSVLSLIESKTCFQLKANFMACSILQLIHYDLDDFARQLASTVQKAPHFFKELAVVIDLEKIKTDNTVQFDGIKKILIEHGLIPIGVKGGSIEQHEAALKENLPALSMKNHNEPLKTKNESSSSKSYQPTKIIETPIRSGMQVYAKECDLVVTAAVSPGAELFSDGNIHVYGTLRGRALAGVQGNKDARIFCRSLDAELVSIAGYYLTKEDMQTLSLSDGVMQIYLDNEQLRIVAI